MGRVLKWIVNIILILAIIVAAALLVPSLTGMTTVMVDRVDMKTNLNKGAVAYAVKDSITDLEVEDKVLLSEGGGEYVYVIQNLDLSDGKARVTDISSPKGKTVEKELKASVNKVVAIVPFIAFFPMALRSTEGLIVVALLVVLLIILFILAEIWTKEGGDEDEEEVVEVESPVFEGVDPTVHLDSNRMLEEADSAIASAVTSAVEEEEKREQRKKDREIAKRAEEEDFSDEMNTLFQEIGLVTEKAVEKTEKAGVEAEEAPVEEALQPVVEPEAGAKCDTAEGMTELTSFSDIPLEVDLVDDQPTREFHFDEELKRAAKQAEEEKTEKEDLGDTIMLPDLAIPHKTESQMLEEAAEKGQDPKVKKDADAGITILDYSNLL